MLLHGETNGLGRDGRVIRNRLPQCVLHHVFTFLGGELQNLQVFASTRLVPSSLAKPIIGDAKLCCGKHFLAVLIVLERAGLANERVDHVSIIDRVLAGTDQARHLLDRHIAVPNFDEISVNHDIDLVANEPTRNRVSVPLDSNRAAGMNLDVVDSGTVIESPQRQLAKDLSFLVEPVSPPLIALVDERLEEGSVVFACREIAASSQQQGLVDQGFQVAVRRFDVSILMGLANIDPLRFDAIVLQQVAIPRSELAVIGKIVDRGAEAVATMPARHAAHLPQRVLQPATEGFKGLGEANGNGLPIGEREREVIEQVIEWPAPNGDPQVIHVGEVGRPHVSGTMDLGEHDLLPRTVHGSPRPNPTLERPPLSLLEPPRM